MKLISSPCTRREILGNVVKLAGATLIPPGLIWGSPGKDAGGYAPKLSVEGYIWTQYFASQKVTLAEGEEEALRETHQAGYQRVELSADFFTPVVREHTRELLAKFALNPESVYAGTTLHEAPAAERQFSRFWSWPGSSNPWELGSLLPTPAPSRIRGANPKMSSKLRPTT